MWRASNLVHSCLDIREEKGVKLCGVWQAGLLGISRAKQTCLFCRQQHPIFSSQRHLGGGGCLHFPLPWLLYHLLSASHCATQGFLRRSTIQLLATKTCSAWSFQNPPPATLCWRGTAHLMPTASVLFRHSYGAQSAPLYQLLDVTDKVQDSSRVGTQCSFTKP